MQRNSPDLPELNTLARQVLAAVRAGAHLDPGPYVHRPLVDDMFGGTPGWEAITADLDIARQE